MHRQVDEGAIFPSREEADHTKPNLFELLAQDQLRDLLHPVVRYVLTYLTQHYPRYFLRLLNHHEEFFAFLLLLVERHHLKKHNASLSEHFYNLRLTNVTPIPTPRLDAIAPRSDRLSRKQRWGLLVFLVGLPYVRARAQDLFDRLSGPSDPEMAPSTRQTLSRAQQAYKTLYPYVNLGFDVLMLSYDVAYLFDKTPFYRPWHRWFGVRVRRVGPDDLAPPGAKRWSDWVPPMLPTLLLALKGAEWWYSPSSPRSQRPKDETSASRHASILPPRPLPILPSLGLMPPTPPATPPLGENDHAAEGYQQSGAKYSVGIGAYGKCPLCGKPWQNPAVLPSGWVVCWRCGWDAIEGEDDSEEEKPSERRGKCPFTGMDVRASELRRVLV